jgi:hypothetical protein
MSDQNDWQPRESDKPFELSAASDFDLDAAAQEATTAAETAELALSLTRIIGGQVEVKAGLLEVKSELAKRVLIDAQRDAAWAKNRPATSAESQRAAFAGAQAGVAQSVDDVASRCEAATKAVETGGKELRNELSKAGSDVLAALAALRNVQRLGVVISLVVSASSWALGRHAGSPSRAEQEAATWALTPSGRAARAIDQSGALSVLIACSGAKWRVEQVEGQQRCVAGRSTAGAKIEWVMP